MLDYNSLSTESVFTVKMFGTTLSINIYAERLPGGPASVKLKPPDEPLPSRRPSSRFKRQGREKLVYLDIIKSLSILKLTENKHHSDCFIINIISSNIN